MSPPKPRVLVVEDNESIRELIKIVLELDDFDVVTASDGRQGLEWALTLNPAVITLDVVMPHMDGLQVLSRLRADERTSSIKVILVSARASEADVRRGVDGGADAYLTKPFDPSELLRTVTELAYGGEASLR